MTYEITPEYRAAQDALWKAKQSALPHRVAVQKAKDDLNIAWYGKKIRPKMSRYNVTQAAAIWHSHHAPNSPHGFQAAMRAVAVADRAHADWAIALAALHLARCKDQARYNKNPKARKSTDLSAAHRRAIARESATYQRWQMLAAAAQSARAGKPVNL